MSKVARAATVGSKQRVETLTANKTILKDETGELYLIDHNAASTLAVTLPSVRSGAYFKFLVITDMTDNTAAFSISTADGAGTLKGVCTAWEDSDFSGAKSELDSSSTTLTIGSNAEAVLRGSNVECYSDGTNWYLIGQVVRTAGGSPGDAVAWS